MGFLRHDSSDDYGFWPISPRPVFSCLSVASGHASATPHSEHASTAFEGVLIWPRRTFDAFCR